MSSLSGIYSTPLIGVAYCLAKPNWQPPVIRCQSTDPAKSITSANVSTTDTLTLLIKVPATVTFYRGHRRTLCCLPGIISLIIMCVTLCDQVTLCDPIWHVSSSSGVATSVSELLYPCYLYFTTTNTSAVAVVFQGNSTRQPPRPH